MPETSQLPALLKLKNRLSTSDFTELLDVLTAVCNKLDDEVGWKSFDFEAFRKGIEICKLFPEDPLVALLRYEPGASVPKHQHKGLETILVLEGEQSDEHGNYSAGSLVLNPEDSIHSVWSNTGCVVLIQWERPVLFLED